MLVNLDSRKKLAGAVILLLFAIILQIVIIYHVQHEEEIDQHGHQETEEDSENSILDPDARSAIGRARSQGCKSELRQVILDRPDESQPLLKRTCPLDDNLVDRVLRLGCLSRWHVENASSSRYVKINEQVSTASECNDLCFSYGHSHACHRAASSDCWCTDNLDPTSEQDQTQACTLEWSRVDNGLYKPEGRVAPPSPIKRPIRIMFLLALNGRSVLQVQRLIKNIYSREHYYYIHVDARQDYLHDKLRLFYEPNPGNIIFARRRYETIWGGTALLTMMVEAMNQTGPLEWDYTINLSETDFPLRRVHELVNHLSANGPGLIYLRSHNMKGYNFIKKQGLNYRFYQCEARLWRLGKRRLPKGIVYSGGSDWVALPKMFCDHILTEMSQPESLVGSLLTLFNQTLLPAESFYHTLALNGEFCAHYVDTNLRVTNWQRKQGCKCQHKQVVDWCGCSPLVYRASDWSRLERIATSNEHVFLSRKFDPTISASVIVALESLITGGNKSDPGEPKASDSRYWLNVCESTGPTGGCPQVYAELGSFAWQQIRSQMPAVRDSSHGLKSVDLHYNNDRLMGYVYRFSVLRHEAAGDNGGSYHQLLVKRRDVAASHRRLGDERCLTAQDRHILSLEVNQDFDTSERLFRNHAPLSTRSEVVVHHEWSVVDAAEGDARKILFKWINPMGRVELIQEIKLKTTTKPSRLSLVHRLVHREPLLPGLWFLIVQDGDEDCLEHAFLVIDDTPDRELGQTASQNQAQAACDRLYEVTHFCVEQEFKSTDDLSRVCVNHEWSLEARDIVRESYALTAN